MAYGNYSRESGFNSTHGIHKNIGTVDQTIHLWAQQTKNSGRSQKGSVYFEGRIIYSYGTHFPMGFFVTPDVVLLNGDKRGVTTSQHQGSVRHAVNHKTRITLPALDKVIDLIHGAHSHHDRPRDDGWSLSNLNEQVKSYFLNHCKDDAMMWLIDHLRGIGCPGLVVEALEAYRAEAAEIKARNKAEAALTKHRDAYERARVMTLDEVRGHVVAMTHAQLKAFLRHVGEVRMAARKEKDKPVVKELDKCYAWVKKLVRDYHFRQKRFALKSVIQRVPHALEVVEGTHHYADHESKLMHTARGRERVYRVLAEQSKVLAELITFPRTRDKLLDLAKRADAARNHVIVQIEAEEARLAAARKQDWLDGLNGSYRSGYGEPVLLRVRGETLETSMGAEVPLTHAIKVFKFLRHVWNTTGTWERNGHTVRVGHFTVDRIDQSGFNAGCHRISKVEVERIAASPRRADVEATTEALEVSHA